MTRTSFVQFREDRRTILTNIAALFSGSALAQGMTAFALLLMARQLGPEQYGQYTSSTLLAMFCSIVFSLGLDLWLLREGGRLPSQIDDLMGSVLTIKALIGLVWLGLMFALASLIDLSSLPTTLVRLSALIVWLANLFRTTLTAFKAILRNKVNASLEVLSVAARFLFTLLLIAMGVKDVSRFMQMQAGVVAVSLLCSLAVAWFLLGIKSSSYTSRRALIASPPYALSDFLAWLFMRVDVLIVALMLGEYAAGIYSPAVAVLNAMFLVPATVHVVIVPVLSKQFTTNIRQAWITARRTIGVLVIVGIVLFVGLLIGARVLVLFLGAEFADSGEILKLLSIIVFLHSINYGIAAILVAGNQQAKRSVAQAIAVLVNIALNVLIIQRAGIRGVAIVYMITEIVLLAGYSWIALSFRRRGPNKSLLIGSEVG